MARRAEQPGQPSGNPAYRVVRQSDLAGGLVDKRNQALLDSSESPDVQNVEFDTDSITNAGGAIKFGNEPAPGGALRTHAGNGSLYLRATPLLGAGNGLTGTVDVPLRGAAYFPYATESDIGGRFDYEGDILAGSATFHNRRGTSFEINVSFQLPPDEKLYDTPSNGAGYTTPALPFLPPHGFDQALDECVCILQKGGDRTAPMSWALAIVNVGAGVGVTNIPAQRCSNYALAFLWYDAPQWGEHATTVMKYNLTSGQSPTGGAAATFSTQAYRTILLGKFIEPGRDYSVSLQLTLDTGSPGGVASNTNWNRNGAFKCFVWEDRRTWWYATAANTALGVITQTSSDGASRMEVVRGPQDSIEYLCCYGIRYAGRDARFAGLGQRFTPWAKTGFIPFGSDLAPLKAGGFSMLDRSTATVQDLYGAATYTLTAVHTSGDAYVVVNHQGLSNANTNGGFDPKVALTSTMWEGLGASRNAEALRGYRLVTTEDWAAGRRGGIMSILSYAEVGASYRLTIYDGANTAAFGDFAANFVLVQCWRWHQRDLIVGQFSTSLTPTDYLAADTQVASRRKIGLRMSHTAGDPTDDRLATLVEYYPLDDAGASFLHEAVCGGLRSGYRIPFAQGVGPGGTRGKNLVFLSGEGEAITLDLSESEVFVRETERMLRGFSQGFGFEITCVFTEAFYALQSDITLTNDAGVTFTGARPALVPDIVSLDVKTNTGRSNDAEPLLTLGFRQPLQSTDGTPFKYPAGLGVGVQVYGDSDNRDPIQPSALQPWYVDASPAPHNRYDVTAPWVGKTVTIQVGVQASAVLGEYDVYIALMPKSAFYPQSGDASNIEMQYWTDAAVSTSLTGTYAGTAYYSAAHLNLRPKDIARAVITIGGGWRARASSLAGTAIGEHELNARMLVDEIRWFVASPSGELGPYASQVATLTARNGKLEGTNCLPPRELEPDDLLQPLGPNLCSVGVTQNAVTVTPATGGSFALAAPRASFQSVQGCFLRLVLDNTFLAEDEELGEYVVNYSYVLSATSTVLTLATAYPGKTRTNADAGVFRLAGYTSFPDDVRDLPLLLGRGGGYSSTSIDSSVILTDDLWANPAVPGDAWRMRVYSPLGSQGSQELLPAWTRGLVFERRITDDGILGLYGWNSSVYAGVRGAIYEADDRWRPDGPTDSLKRSLAFRNREYPAGLSGPLQRDALLYTTSGNARFIASPTDAYATLFDVWVNLDEIRAYQTVVYLGSLDSDPALSAGTAAHKIQYWWRFNAGRPEIVFGSTATYDGTNRPEKGLFVAQGAIAIPASTWTHVRISVPTSSSGVNVRVPYMQVNGKTIAVSVNARENGVTGLNWITSASVVNSVTGSTVPTVVMLGAARDSFRAPEPIVDFVAGVGGLGTLVSPGRIQGLLHALGGRVADVTISRQPMWSGTGGPPDFDPYLLTYNAPTTVVCLHPNIQKMGVGARIEDQSGAGFGIMQGSPFVSVFHEMGTSRDLYSFAEYGSQLYVTNGGKPVVVFP